MPIGIGLGISAAAGLIGSVVQGNAASSAANSQANAATNAARMQTQASIEQQQALLAAGKEASKQFDPYAQSGMTALSNLANNNDYFNHQFNAQDLQNNLSPNYQFMLNQGLGANTQNANVSGGGSNVNRSNQVFSQNYASNAYQNAFNNYQTQRGNIYATNMGQANLGLSGATGSANAQLGTATNVASLGIGAANANAASTVGAANANAAGTIGSANAYSNGLNSLGNVASYYALTNGGNNFIPTAGNSFII